MFISLFFKKNYILFDYLNILKIKKLDPFFNQYL